MILSTTQSPLRRRFGNEKALEILKNSGFDGVDFSLDNAKSEEPFDFTNHIQDEYLLGMDKYLVKCLHIHDTDGKQDKHWTPYQGSHNWQNILSALNRIGYNGDMNFEIIGSFNSLPNELIPHYCEYIVKVGKYMIKELQKL